MSSRPLTRAVVSRQHMRLAGALAFNRRTMTFCMRRLARAGTDDAPPPQVAAFTRQALSLRGVRTSAP